MNKLWKHAVEFDWKIWDRIWPIPVALWRELYATLLNVTLLVGVADHRAQPTSRRTTVSGKDLCHAQTGFVRGDMGLLFREPQSNWTSPSLLAWRPARRTLLIFCFSWGAGKFITAGFDCINAFKRLADGKAGFVAWLEDTQRRCILFSDTH